MIHLTYKDFKIPEDRIRREFNQEAIEELTESISEIGILHPPVFRKVDDEIPYRLVAGERRVRAMRPLIDIGKQIKTTSGDGETFIAPLGTIPGLLLDDLDEHDIRKAELEENVKRENITWQEKVRAEAEIHEIYVRTRKEKGESWTEKDSATSLYDDLTPDSAENKLKRSLTLAKALDDETIAKADNPHTAMKLLKRKRESEQSAKFADFLKQHTNEEEMMKLHHGDCIKGLMEYDGEPFDLFIMDPPYGIDAQNFKQGDRTATESLFRHKYDDSQESFEALLSSLVTLITRHSAEQSVVYQFCDIQRWRYLVDLYESAGWSVWKWPMIYLKRGKGLAPSPEYGPQRRYETILYANKGRKRLRYVRSDVLGLSDKDIDAKSTKLHAAGKPVWLMQDLIDRTVPAGSRVCDPCMGTGPSAVASKRLSMFFHGWELDEDTYNKALVRLSTDEIGDESGLEAP